MLVAVLDRLYRQAGRRFGRFDRGTSDISRSGGQEGAAIGRQAG